MAATSRPLPSRSTTRRRRSRRSKLKLAEARAAQRDVERRAERGARRHSGSSILRACSSSTADLKYSKAVLRALDVARWPVHLPQVGGLRAAGALRGEGRQAGAAELPGARRHLRRAEGAGPRPTSPWARSGSRSSSRGGSHGRAIRRSGHSTGQRSCARCLGASFHGGSRPG